MTESRRCCVRSAGPKRRLAVIQESASTGLGRGGGDHAGGDTDGDEEAFESAAVHDRAFVRCGSGVGCGPASWAPHRQRYTSLDLVLGRNPLPVQTVSTLALAP